MTPLGSLLDAGLVPGVHTWSSALDVAYVRGVVRRAGWVFAHLDGAQVLTVGALHEALAEALGFPDYYGRNLDALADCLSDQPDAQVLLWDDWGAFAETEPRVAAVVLDLLGSSRVTTLLRGEGPPISGVGRT
ncbi:barstar family protein [Nocardioides sp.]|uniref:barstar family protein n=1 Tax=Nocardioides sp. TaxID=35761 RepID=UPI002B279D10|nr:barstar family protein [Nocardioides sp.]